MEVYSLSFLFLALPVAIVLCLLTPPRWRPPLLLAFSALLYWWLERENTAVLAAVILFDYAMARLMEKCAAFPGLRRAVMICAVAKSVALIALYGILTTLGTLHVPLGLSVVCLTGIGYVIDCYNGYVQLNKSPVDFALMAAFFPKLYAGPLAGTGKLLPQLRSLRMTLERIGTGAELIIKGLAKKVVLGDVLFGLYYTLRGTPIYDMSVLGTWVMVALLALSTYFLLSGLCDLAKGIGQLFGFELPDNFGHPYCAASVDDFFSRFNITVNKFIRRYVYFSLGGTAGSMLSGVFNILLATILMGLWFGVRLNILIWGIYFGLFVMLDRYVLRRYKDSIPTLFRWLYTQTVVLFSFAIFAGDTPQMSLRYFQLMLGMGGAGGSDKETVYLLISNFLVLLVAILASTNLSGLISDFLKRHAAHTWAVLSATLYAALFIVTISMMV